MPDFSLGFGHSLSPQTPATFPPRFGGAHRPSQRGTIPRKSPYFGCGIMRPRPFPTPPRGTGPPVSGPPDTGNGRVSMAPASALAATSHSFAQLRQRTERRNECDP